MLIHCDMHDVQCTFLLPSPSPGARWSPGVVLYPTPLTNIVIMSPICFISHCPLGQHICAFMHWGHDYHSMFSLHLLFAEAGRRHHLGTELMARGYSQKESYKHSVTEWHPYGRAPYSSPQIHVFLYKIWVLPLGSILVSQKPSHMLVWLGIKRILLQTNE